MIIVFLIILVSIIDVSEIYSMYYYRNVIFENKAINLKIIFHKCIHYFFPKKFKSLRTFLTNPTLQADCGKISDL